MSTYTAGIWSGGALVYKDGEIARIEDVLHMLNSHAELVAALQDANALILAPAEDLKDGVLSRIRAALKSAGALT